MRSLGYTYDIAAYVNYRDHEQLEEGQYVLIKLNERHLPSEIIGQIVLSGPTLGRPIPVKFVKFLDELDGGYWLIMLCGGEGSSEAEIRALDEIEYKIMIA
jgi:hypothetical protein